MTFSEHQVTDLADARSKMEKRLRAEHPDMFRAPPGPPPAPTPIPRPPRPKARPGAPARRGKRGRTGISTARSAVNSVPGARSVGHGVVWVVMATLGLIALSILLRSSIAVGSITGGISTLISRLSNETDPMQGNPFGARPA
jgi:hypothetical protein